MCRTCVGRCRAHNGFAAVVLQRAKVSKAAAAHCFANEISSPRCDNAKAGIMQIRRVRIDYVYGARTMKLKWRARIMTIATDHRARRCCHLLMRVRARQV